MPKQRVIIAPSILSADITRLDREVRALEKGGADWIHLDIMDGHFVPNITFGPMLAKGVRALTKLPLDAHLMITSPDRYIDDFAGAGVNRLTVHVETCSHLHRTVQRIREAGMKPGVTLNPATSSSTLKEIIPFVDLVLVMTVNPGFGGQAFITPMIAKIAKIAAMIADANDNALLQVDGGIDASNARRVVEAGANVLVAGNAIFSKRSVPQAVRALRAAALRSSPSP